MVVDVMNNFSLDYQKKNQKQEKNQKKNEDYYFYFLIRNMHVQNIII